MTDQLQFDFGTAVYSEYDSDDFLGVSIDHCGDGAKVGAPPAAVCMPFGLFGRPLDPVKDDRGQVSEGCSVIWWRHGDTISAMPITDPRVQKILPALEKGEVCIANAFGQFVRLAKDGKVTLFTTDDGTPTGKSVYFQVAKDGFTWVAPWGTIKFNDTGFHILHSSGARFDLGGIYGVPGGLSTYVSAQAGSIDWLGSHVTQGAGNNQQQLAAAQPLIAIITQLLTLLAVTPAVAPGAPLLPAAAALQGQLATIISSAASG